MSSFSNARVLVYPVALVVFWFGLSGYAVGQELVEVSEDITVNGMDEYMILHVRGEAKGTVLGGRINNSLSV